MVDQIVGIIDFSSIIYGIGALGLSFALLQIAVMGARTLLSFIRGSDSGKSYAQLKREMIIEDKRIRSSQVAMIRSTRKSNMKF